MSGEQEDPVSDEIKAALAWFDSRYPDHMAAASRSSWKDLLAIAIRKTAHDLQTALSHRAQAVAELKDANDHIARLAAAVFDGIEHLQQAPK